MRYPDPSDLLPILLALLIHTEPAAIIGVEVSETLTMKNRSGEASLLRDQAHELRTELARKIALFIGSAENRATSFKLDSSI